jgi:ABC-type transport system involved in multi-copper enzyme maturation permease subunit
MRLPRASPMLGAFAAFEFTYQLRSAMFVVTAAIFFAFSFALVSVPQMSRAIAGVSHINSPHAIAMIISSMAWLGMFIPVVFLSSVVMRDHELDTEGLFFTRPVTEFDYLAGRFIGAFAVCCLVLFVTPLAILAGSFAPWLDLETVGPLRPFDYVYNYLVFGAANLLIPGALLFTVANLTRSTMATYTATVLFLVFYFAGSALGANAEYRTIVALFDPYGLFAYLEITRYWSPHELNTRLVPLEGLLLWNRVIWLGLSAALLVYNVAAFSFRPGKEKQRRKGGQARGAETVAVAGSPKATLSFGPATLFSQFLLRVRYEAGRVFRSFSFWAVLLIALGLVALALVPPPTPVYPLTRVVINATSQFEIVLMLVVIYFAAELMWRDRGYRMQDILHATPAPSWVFVASKLATLWLVLFALSAVCTAAAIAVQIVRGASWADVELSLYLRRTFFFNFYTAFLLSISSTFFQAVTNNRYVGMLALIVVGSGLDTALRALGVEHNLFHFPSAPGTPYSDMNGDGHFLVAKNWFLFYWTWFAALLLVLAFALWNRGALTPVWLRVRTLPVRLGRAGVQACAVLLVGFMATGAYIFYNTNVLNTYRTSRDMERLAFDYENAYRQYETLPQPRIVGTQLNVDIYPRERRYQARGSYVIENKTDAPIPHVHVGYGLGTIVRSQQLEGAALVASDDRQLHYIWQFGAPLQPGERRTLTFTVVRENPGFRSGSNISSVVWNGTFFNNLESMPVLGFNPRRMLQDLATRRRYDLEPIDRMPPLEDDAAASRNYIVADADWMAFEATVSTSADQIAIAPGNLQREWEENGRRYFHYRMETPILNFYAFLSARYEVTEEVADGVRLQVFHHPAHRYNVKRMIDAMRDGIAYNSAAFPPFQHRQMRIFEYPQFFGGGAQGFPNSVPDSERYGFIADNRDPRNLDRVYKTTTHEVGHQWWFGQLVGGAMQGATMLSETFAQYSALMVMKREYGEHQIRRFLKDELDKYLNGRGGEAVNEMPLYRVENQSYIHYNKGSLVMYALQDYIGEDVVNRALARLLREHAYASRPYPRSTDFLRILRAEAGPGHEALIADLFEKIVLFDLRATNLSVARRSDGRFAVRLSVEAKKFEASGKGVETEVPLDYAIDIGLFVRHPDDVTDGDGHVLLLERRAVTAGKNVFEFVLEAAPEFGGIDPYNKLIDRVSGDNIISIDGKFRQQFQVSAPDEGF